MTEVLPDHPRYRLERKLGEGATSDVYAAVMTRDHGFARHVAVKQLRAGAQDTLQIEAFIEEVRVTCNLRHPNVVGVLDFGVLDGMPFSVLELVEGRNALELLELAVARGEPLPPEVALHIVHETAMALDYVHRATDAAGERLRIVHCDISPDNLIVADSGHVKLADFSVARAFRRPRHTEAGKVRGTVDYMAPEQLRFEAVTPRTDLFALGCVLHALLSGVSPTASVEAREELVADGVVAPSASLDPDVRKIVARAIQPRPSERYEHARAMAEACWRALVARIDRDARLVTADWIDARKPPALAPERPSTREIRLRASSDGIRIFMLQDTADADGPTRLVPPTADGDTTLDAKATEPRVPVAVEKATRLLPPPSDDPPRRLRSALVTAVGGVAVGAVIAGGLILGLRESSPPVVPLEEAPAQEIEPLWLRVDALRAKLVGLPPPERMRLQARLAALRGRIEGARTPRARQDLLREIDAVSRALDEAAERAER